MAGQIAELARGTLRATSGGHRHSRPRACVLVEAADRVLHRIPALAVAPSAERRSLAPSASHPCSSTTVDRRRGQQRSRSPAPTATTRSVIAARTVVWAAGVRPSSLARQARARLSGAECDRSGRLDRRGGPHAARPSGRPRRSATWSRLRQRRPRRASCRASRLSRCSRAAHAAGGRPRAAARQAPAAVPLPRQGQPGDDRPRPRGRRPPR